MMFETLLDAAGTPASAPAYAEIVAELAARRRVVESARFLIDEVGDRDKPLVDTVSTLTGTIQESATIEGGNEFVTWGDCLNSVWAGLENPEQASKRVATGIPQLDRISGGLCNNLTVLAARPGMGKSALAGCIARNVARACIGDEAVYIACLEDDGDTFARRGLAGAANVSMTKLDNPEHNPIDMDEFRSIRDAISRDYNLPILFDKRPARTTDKIRSQVFALRKNRPVKLVIVDHLQRLVDDDNAYASTSMACRAMANLSGDFGVPVLLLTQLNRNLESRTDKRPIPSDLRDSGKIEEDARAIWFLYRDAVYNESAPEKEGEIIIAKSNHGQTGIVRVYVDLDKMYIGEEPIPGY
jgi:replicative DNA helicase